MKINPITFLFAILLSFPSFAQNNTRNNVQNNIPNEIKQASAQKFSPQSVPFDALFEAGFCRLAPSGVNMADALKKNSHEFLLNGKIVNFFPSSNPLIDYSNIQVVQFGKVWWSIPYGSNKNVRIPALNIGAQFSKEENNTYTLNMLWPGISIDSLSRAIFAYKSGWRFVTQSEIGGMALAGPDYNALEESGASILLVIDPQSGLTKMVYRCQPR